MRSWSCGLKVEELSSLSKVLGSITSTTHTQKGMEAKHPTELERAEAAPSQVDTLLGFQAHNS